MRSVIRRLGHTVLSILFSLMTLTLYGQSSEGVVLELMWTQCPKPPDSVYLFYFDGVSFIPQRATAADTDGHYRFTLDSTPPTFYYLGLSAKNIRPLLAGSEPLVKIKGPCQRLSNATIASPLNAAYAQLKRQLNSYQQQADRLAQSYRQASTAAQRQAAIAHMVALDSTRIAFIDSLEQMQPTFAQIARLNTWLSYPNHGQAYPNEIVYFAKAYFQLVDWQHPLLPYVYPWIHQAFNRYAQTLSRVGYLPDSLHQWMMQSLEQVPKRQGMHRYALAGILAGLQRYTHPSYPQFAQLFIDTYGQDFPQAAAQVKKQMEQLASFIIGAPAPDFTQLTPEGDSLSLSDLRGKVVLIDFWASWCGPCRRENPHVVKLYEKYKDKGFDILGVSLDRQRARWIQAIKADGLTWHHVSDLKGWQNEVAQLYGVRSIPHTVLVDRDGRIIARKLRGPALEAKLAELFDQ